MRLGNRPSLSVLGARLCLAKASAPRQDDSHSVGGEPHEIFPEVGGLCVCGGGGRGCQGQVERDCPYGWWLLNKDWYFGMMISTCTIFILLFFILFLKIKTEFSKQQHQISA